MTDHNNTETLKLWKNQFLYNGSRYQYLMTGRTGTTATQTFETWLGTPDYNKTVYYKSIDEPIKLNESIKSCDEYTYGSITNDGKTYYFFVDSITTDAYKQTTINYTVDWWTTNWSKITGIKGHLTRKPTKPGYMQQPYIPLNTTHSSSSLTVKYSILATYIPSTVVINEDDQENNVDKSQSYISYIILDGTDENLQLVAQGTWYNQLGIAGADIKDCFIVPFFDYDSFIDEDNSLSKPIFVINVDAPRDILGTDHSNPVNYPGAIMQAWMDKYPCLTPNPPDWSHADTAFWHLNCFDYIPGDANTPGVTWTDTYQDPVTGQYHETYIGLEILYNQTTGKYYHPLYYRYKRGNILYWRWKWVEIEDNPIDEIQVAEYWSE